MSTGLDVEAPDHLLSGGAFDPRIRAAQLLYRYEDYAQEGNRTALFRFDLNILGETEHFWLVRHNGVERRVKKKCTKRFACPTHREALDSFIARKTRQIQILGARLHRATQAKDAASTLLKTTL